MIWNQTKLGLILFVCFFVVGNLLVIENWSVTDLLPSTTRTPADQKNSDNDAVSRMQQLLKTKHEGCFSRELFKFRGSSDKYRCNRRVLDLKKSGRYSMWKDVANMSSHNNDNVSVSIQNPVRYNYQCPFIKPRYNCAKTSNYVPNAKGVATDWKLSLVTKPPNENNNTGRHEQVCNLWNFVDDLGGPIGVAEKLLKEKKKKVGGKNKNPNVINVVMLGNSFLRQVFEALICGFQNDITNIKLQKGQKFGISMSEIKERKGRPVELNEIGDLVAPPLNIETGASTPSQEYWYQPGLPLPVSFENFDDNIAMVEFGGVIKFYYFFRSFVFANLTEVTKAKLNLDIYKDADFLVFNNGESQKFDASLFESSEQNGCNLWDRKIELPNTFRFLQKRDIGKWFGANNPGIYNPPDSHACMPGVPDDEINWLLFLLYFDAT